MAKIITQFLVRKPVGTLVLSFLVAIFIGTILLQLPWATPRGISFLSALFTATSATCVTGLTVLSTGSDFTLFGKIVILLLIQVGGLGIMTAAAFAILFFKKVGIGTQVGLKTVLEERYISDVKKTIKFVVINTFILEAIGAFLLFFWWRHYYFGGTSQLIFSSVFHAISAFCNAGFSLFNNSLESFRGDIFVNIVFYFLIISGGIGFLVIKDFYQKIVSLLKRQKVRLSVHSKIVLISTTILILLGAILFYFFESGNLSFLSQKELVLSSFFQTITARTAGFHTVDIGQVSPPTSLLLIFLMYVGAAPTSAAGGIKVTVLVLIFLSIISFFKKEEEVVVFHRTIPKIYIKKAFVLASVYLLFCLVIFLFMLYTEKVGFEKILFEVFSATGTVGLSAGITPYLTNLGKILIIISMFVGRLLPISLVIIGLKEAAKPKILFPEEKIILG